jgi:hypothetical protein
MGFGALGGLFFIWFLFVFAIVLIPLGLTIYALYDVIRSPDAAFGPPWDNCKTMWTLGIALGFVIPAGTIVAPILYWMQVRPALRAQQQVPRPFWSPRPSYPPQYPMPYGGQYPQPPQGPPPMPPTQLPPA